MIYLWTTVYLVYNINCMEKLRVNFTKMILYVNIALFVIFLIIALTVIGFSWEQDKDAIPTFLIVGLYVVFSVLFSIFVPRTFKMEYDNKCFYYTRFGKEEVLTGMQDSIALYDNGYLNADSIQLPFFRKSNLNSQPLAIMDDELLTDAAMEHFISQVNGMFTDEMVFKFMEEVFEDKEKVEMEDFRIVNFDVLILIILATIKRSDPNAFYEVDFTSKEKVRTQGYILPKMTFRRKEK